MLTNRKNLEVITANGEYQTEEFTPGREANLEWCITGGTATIVPGYVNLDGGFTAAMDAAGTPAAGGASGGMLRMDIPNSGRLAFKVTDAAASGPVAFSMKFCVTLIHRGY